MLCPHVAAWYPGEEAVKRVVPDFKVDLPPGHFEVGDHPFDRFHKFSIRCDLSGRYVVYVVLELLRSLKQCDGTGHVLDVQEIYRIVGVTEKYVLEARRSSAHSRMNETSGEAELCTVEWSEHSH